MPIIEVKNLKFTYDKKHFAVNDVSLSINRGEFVCILGHNGSGKSTLAKLIVGLLRPNSGEIFIDNELLDIKSVDNLRKKLGIVFQNPDNQFVGVTVRDDIAFGLENHQFPREEIIARTKKYARKASMEHHLDSNPENLSGGEKQRVAIAGILAMNPEVIIFDEATSMLDPRGVRDVVEIINQLKGEKTLITITHNLLEALYADRVVVMNDGQIILTGTPAEVFSQHEILKNSDLDILNTMKILELLKNDKKIARKEELEELLWELTFKK